MAQKKEFEESVRKGKKARALGTQTYLKIAEIRDNVAVLKNGGLRAVLKTSSINLHLKSEEEQDAVIYSYQNFLNSLEFPLQIVVRSKKLDLDNYVENLKKIGEKQENRLLQQQTFEYIEYIERLLEYANIMDKEFYVVVPYDPYRAKKISFFQRFLQGFQPKDNLSKIRQRHQEFEELRKGLNQRVNVVKAGLQNCGLQVEQLKTAELISLFYQVYNPLTSREEKIKTVGEFTLEMDQDLVGEKKEKK